MKHTFLMILALSAPAFAAPNEIVNETFKTTFSDYNQLDKMLTCSPGYQGGFATGDTLRLASHAVELGFNVENDAFRAESYDALNQEGFKPGPAKKRPYEKGCQPAIDKIRAAIAGKEVVEVEVHRRVSDGREITQRVNRKRDGEVNFVKTLETDTRLEIVEVEIAGFKFQIFRSLNGAAREL